MIQRSSARPPSHRTARRIPMWLAAMVISAAASTAHAAPPDPERGKRLADAGALAASVGDYAFAIQALGEAYEVDARPDLLFALAEAHRQRNALEPSPTDLGRAVDFYRLYLAAAPTGDHAPDAARTQALLEPTLAAANADDSSSKERRGDARATRLAVLSTLTDASVRIDRQKAVPIPAFASVSPGKHVLTVTSPGHRSLERTIEVPEGRIDMEAFSLDPLPARLDVREPAGADVYVDAIAVGIAPLAAPLDLEPGAHTIAISMNGHFTHTEHLSFARGKTQTLSVDLKATRQRTAAWALVGTGIATLSGGIALGVVAVVKGRSVQNIGGRFAEPLSPSEQRRYDDAIAVRDRFRVGAGIAGGLGLGMAVIGGALFAFDAPLAPSSPRRDGSAPKAGLSVMPIVDPTFTGGFASVRF